MQKSQTLQDAFLNQARREKLTVTMFLMNGFQLHGIVRGFDGFTVVLDSDGKQQQGYGHQAAHLHHHDNSPRCGSR